MSAIEQNYLEREAANRLREARDFADRERLGRDWERHSTRGQVTTGWAIFGLVMVGLAFVIFLT